MLSVIMCYDNRWRTYGPEETVSANANKTTFGAVRTRPTAAAKGG